MYDSSKLNRKRKFMITFMIENDLVLYFNETVMPVVIIVTIWMFLCATDLINSHQDISTLLYVCLFLQTSYSSSQHDLVTVGL